MAVVLTRLWATVCDPKHRGLVIVVAFSVCIAILAAAIRKDNLARDDVERYQPLGALPMGSYEERYDRSSAADRGAVAKSCYSSCGGDATVSGFAGSCFERCVETKFERPLR